MPPPRHSLARLLVTRRMTAAAEAAIGEEFDATFRDSTTPLTEAEATAALAHHDAIMPTLGDGFTAAAFAAAPPRARVLGNFGAGFNHIDLAAAAEAGVVVTNTPEVVTDATADIALTLILMTARRAGEGERLVRAGRWKGWHPTQMLGMHVTGRTVGIIGMGRIGQAIARRCHGGFAMQVLFHNRRGVTGLGFPARQVPLPELLASSDIVVLAVPSQTLRENLSRWKAHLRPDVRLVSLMKGIEVETGKRMSEVIAEVAEAHNQSIEIPIGCMIELPRAALTANRIAQTADFFSFGTNDLTQTTWGFSRDDVETAFFPKYLENGVLTISPFETLDALGVGELVRTGVDKGRATQPGLKTGVCGEHGGDPESIHFFHEAGLDYVSCSPFRVPVARLEAGRAVVLTDDVGTR